MPSTGSEVMCAEHRCLGGQRACRARGALWPTRAWAVCTAGCCPRCCGTCRRSPSRLGHRPVLQLAWPSQHCLCGHVGVQTRTALLHAGKRQCLHSASAQRQCWRLSRGGARAQFTLYENLRRLVERRRKVAKLRTWQHLLLGGLSGALQRKQLCPEHSDTVLVWCIWDHPLLDSLSGMLKRTYL